MKVLTRRRLVATLLGFAALALAALALGLVAGSSGLPLGDVLDALRGRAEASAAADIVLRIRLPRVLLAALVGGSLAVAGVLFQALLRNPLADPFVLGVSGGAAVGGIAALSLGAALGFGQGAVPPAAFAGAVVTTIVLYAVAGDRRELQADRQRFNRLLTFALGVLFAGVVGAVLVQVRFGLEPLRRMGRALGGIRAGAATRLEGGFPAEIEPLATELNALLDHNEALVERARTHVGNLAHGLKTGHRGKFVIGRRRQRQRLKLDLAAGQGHQRRRLGELSLGEGRGQRRPRPGRVVAAGQWDREHLLHPQLAGPQIGGHHAGFAAVPFECQESGHGLVVW